MDPDQHHLLVTNLMRGVLPGTESGQARLIETHISSVIVCDEVVYKLKKPVDLGFLDFSTLDKRHFFCNEELRLNRRFSPQLYLDVLPIFGTSGSPSLQADGEVLDYTLRMKPFDQATQLDLMLDAGQLDARMLASLAEFLAGFHLTAETAPTSSDFASPQRVWAPVELNFRQVRGLVSDPETDSLLDQVEQWSQGEFERHEPLFESRRAQGFIRECHGDLHLRNLAWHDDAPLLFDCIEFEPNLYWIDVINDIAFLWMDLRYRDRPDLAAVLLNRYLERSGDYAGLALLRYYAVYRAMVRAKIAAISLSQATGPAAITALRDELTAYLRLALSISGEPQRAVYLMHGPSGSGKSYLANQVSGYLDALVIRSDAVRKQLFAGIDDAPQGTINQGIYSADASRKTYTRLQQMAEVITGAGYAVIVDATFNQLQYRAPFRRFAGERGLPLVVIDLHAPRAVLLERVEQRRGDISDADVRVLQHQLQGWKPLADDELAQAITVDTAETLDYARLGHQIKAMASSMQPKKIA